MPAKPVQVLEGFEVRLPGVMRMYADRGIDVGVPVGDPHGALEIRRPVARPNRQERLDAGFPRPVEHSVAVRLETLAVQMAVRIDQHYRLSKHSVGAG